MIDWVMFGVVVTHVVGAGAPINVKLALFYSVLYPVESHVDGFGADLFAGFVGNGDCCGVVYLDWCCRLGVAEFFQDDADGNCFFAVVEQGTNFGFCGRRHDIAEDFG